MYPILNIGPAAIQLPGLILLVGFWLSLNLAGRRAKATGLSEDAIFNAGFLGLFTGLIGARLGYVAVHWSAYQNDLLGIAALTTGALSTASGLLVGGATAALYLYRNRPSVPLMLDALAPAGALMLAFISLADLSAGSAYGAVSDVPWALELWGARRHPTQVYELCAAVATLGILWQAHAHRPYDGFAFLLFLAIYGAARLFLDAFRADPRLVLGEFRAVQVLGLGVLVLSLWLMNHQASHDSAS